MRYYFGFLPSTQLKEAIAEASVYTESLLAGNHEKTDKPLYHHRDKITQLINQELLQVMLVQMIDSLPDDSDRKAQLRKISRTIETTADKLVSTLLAPAEDKAVLPSFDFLQQKSLFTDNMGEQRVGFLLDNATAEQLLAGFSLIKQGNKEQALPKLTAGFTGLAQANLTHFLVDFTQTLKLGTLKKATIPLADSVINKGIGVAINKLLPQLPLEGLERITAYYETMIIQNMDNSQHA